MKQKKVQALIVFLFISSFIFSQDLIIKRDSTKIFCKVIKEDSLTIFYKPTGNKKAPEQSIPKADVIQYFNKATLALALQAKNKVDTVQRIWQASELKPGLYKSAREFITNSPSIKKKIIVYQRNWAEVVFMLGGGEFSFDLTAGQGTVDYGEITGFCDGLDAYVSYDNPNGYSKVEHLGPYSYFTYKYSGALVLIDEEGYCRSASPHYIKQILAVKYPELLIQYKAEPDQMIKRKEYIRQLNNYLKSKVKK